MIRTFTYTELFSTTWAFQCQTPVVLCSHISWLSSSWYEREEHSKANLTSLHHLPQFLNWGDPWLNSTMLQYACNVKIKGGSFTIINEQNGMTGALYGFIEGRYLLTVIHAKVSRFCIDGSQMALPMTLLNMHPNVTQILARLLLLTSWTGSATPLALAVSYGSMAWWAQARQQLLSLCKHCADAQWLAGSFFFLQHAPSRSNAEFLFSTLAFEHHPWGWQNYQRSVANDLSRRRNPRYSYRNWFLNHCNGFRSNLSTLSLLLQMGSMNMRVKRCSPKSFDS